MGCRQIYQCVSFKILSYRMRILLACIKIPQKKCTQRNLFSQPFQLYNIYKHDFQRHYLKYLIKINDYHCTVLIDFLGYKLNVFETYMIKNVPHRITANDIVINNPMTVLNYSHIFRAIRKRRYCHKLKICATRVHCH